MYRLGLAIAGGSDTPAEGPAKASPTVWIGNEVENDKIKTAKFRGLNWNVEFEPTVASIQRLRMQAQANAETPHFAVRVVNNELKFSFGDHSTHAGEFVFHNNANGTLARTLSWPVVQVLAILSLVGDKYMQISDGGAMQITVDSGLAKYNYILPSQSK